MTAAELELKLVDRFVGLAPLLAKTLPANHPVALKVEELREELSKDPEQSAADLMDEGFIDRVPELQGALAALVDVTEDWQRGIRDWDEVDEVLKDAKSVL